MKKILMILAGCMALMGCGNSGVSQEQYESVVAERDEYKAKIESISAFFDEMDNALNESQSESETNIQSEGQSNPQKVILLGSGWCSYKHSDYCHVPYAVQIQNPNQDYAIGFPTITITAKDTDGKILSTDEQVLNSIAANDIIFYGNDFFYEGDEPATVEISVSNAERNFANQDDSKYVSQNDFTISNISENNGNYKKFTGEVTNNSKVDFDTVAVIVIYKNNDNIIGGEVEYVKDLIAGSTKAFELSSDSDEFEYDSYEFYAIQW